MPRRQFLEYCQGLKGAIDAVTPDAVEAFIQTLESACQEGRQLFLMGNGGSGSPASHAACDLNKGVSFGREQRFRAICLNDYVATLSAYANDVCHNDVFVDPLRNFLRPGDVVVGISGSGNSPNVLKAIDYANHHGEFTVGLCGFDGGRLASLVRLCVHVPVRDMQKVEDIHMMLFHLATQVLVQNERQKETSGPATKEEALAKVAPMGKPFRRFRASDRLLAFLELL